MPVTAVTYQPETDSLNSAYRPFIFRCKAQIPNSTTDKYICPVVYCDIYVEGIYYKTLSRTQYIKNDGLSPEYEFDIQDTIQELMDYNLPIMNGFIVEKFTNTIKHIYVKFRNGFNDPNGFIKSEQLEPIQGTSSTQPVSGGGTKSNEVYGLNSVIQHEESQNFDELLDSYKTGLWAYGTYPLTKRPMVYLFCKNDSSHFPIISNVEPKEVCIKYKTVTGEVITICSDKIMHCPFVSNVNVVKKIIGTTQEFEITWTNPVINNQSAVRIYWKKQNTATWTYQEYPMMQPVIISVDSIGVMNFRLMVIGSCISNSFNELPEITI
ncbi:hypothetical protein C1637_09930 [Chryseobacterium lactis]|uniref:Fibronectin type III domain-containing protein n=1 Tax=Chryseobacterium lactis TaxID=1241981 RepID=A0A3G6RBX6_CHRLC|nr:hypothetical protein [Chryseobacterium lactis]AZA82171.1 hypothetical protein EG342_09770 [Chryseobacterium lactis]AZB02552.1 hypothetical protein EG341_00625 [Chryseobacterium lactis]PNW14153.1 hypothetical protein C1637_09930 [Chryseobacterium lactis]